MKANTLKTIQSFRNATLSGVTPNTSNKFRTNAAALLVSLVDNGAQMDEATLQAAMTRGGMKTDQGTPPKSKAAVLDIAITDGHKLTWDKETFHPQVDNVDERKAIRLPVSLAKAGKVAKAKRKLAK